MSDNEVSLDEDFTFTVTKLEGRKNPWRVRGVIDGKEYITRVDAKNEKMALAEGRHSLLKAWGTMTFKSAGVKFKLGRNKSNAVRAKDSDKST